MYVFMRKSVISFVYFSIIYEVGNGKVLYYYECKN